MNQRLNISDLLADEFTTHTIRLFRFDASLRRRIRKLLQQHVQRELVAELANNDPTGPTRTAFQHKRVDALAADAQKIVRAGYRTVAKEHASAMGELATLEEEFARTTVNRVVGTKLLTITVPDAKLREIARTVLVDGAPSADWWGGQADRTRKMFERTVRKGLTAGDSIGDMVSALRGTAARNFADSAFAPTWAEAESLCRTSTMAVTQAVHMASYEANDDIVDGVEQLSTLDGRTTVLCASLHGSSWRFDGTAFPDSPFQGNNPPYPRHWGERSLLMPRLKPLPKMMSAASDRKASRIDALSVEMQDRLDGQVAASTDFETFLRSKPDAFANELLGKTKAQLFRDGKIKSLAQILDGSARPLRIDELRDHIRGVTNKAIEQARAA